MPMEFFSRPDMEIRDDPREKATLLEEDYELGKKREQLLLQNRDSAGLDEGLFAYTNDAR